MAKYWVTFSKYAGAQVEADNAEGAMEKAGELDESEYEFNQIFGDDWRVENAEEIPLDE